jgi:hypothetical protein
MLAVRDDQFDDEQDLEVLSDFVSIEFIIIL